VYFVRDETPIEDAVSKMALPARRLVVTAEGDRVAGILTSMMCSRISSARLRRSASCPSNSRRYQPEFVAEFVTKLARLGTTAIQEFPGASREAGIVEGNWSFAHHGDRTGAPAASQTAARASHGVDRRGTNFRRFTVRHARLRPVSGSVHR
jgi:hypothetical protein